MKSTIFEKLSPYDLKGFINFFFFNLGVFCVFV